MLLRPPQWTNLMGFIRMALTDRKMKLSQRIGSYDTAAISSSIYDEVGRSRARVLSWQSGRLKPSHHFSAIVHRIHPARNPDEQK
jgi:hypothetical protein